MTLSGSSNRRDLVIAIQANDEASQELENIGQESEETGQSFAGLGRSIAGLALGMFSLTAVAPQLTRAMDATADSVGEAQFTANLLGPAFTQALEEAEPAFREIAQFAGTTESEVRNAFTELQRQSGRADVSLSNLRRTMAVAEVANIGTAEAARLVGQALAGNEEPLQELLGPFGYASLNEVLAEGEQQFDDAQTELEAFTGALERAAESLAEGEFIQALEDLVTAIGELSDVGDVAFSIAVDFLIGDETQELINWFADRWDDLTDLSRQLGFDFDLDFGIDVDTQDVIQWFIDRWVELIELASPLNFSLGLLVDIANDVMDTVNWFVDRWEDLQDFSERALDFVLTLDIPNPGDLIDQIGSTLGDIGEFVFELLPDLPSASSIEDTVSDIVRSIGDFFFEMVPDVNLSELFDRVSDIPDFFFDMVPDVGNIASEVDDAVDRLADFFFDMVPRIDFSDLFDRVSDLPDFFFDMVPDLPSVSDIRREIEDIIDSLGDFFFELVPDVNPFSSSSTATSGRTVSMADTSTRGQVIMPEGQTGGDNINVNVSLAGATVDSPVRVREIARETARLLREDRRRGIGV